MDELEPNPDSSSEPFSQPTANPSGWACAGQGCGILAVIALIGVGLLFYMCSH